MPTVRVRIAPSPTGAPHVGTAYIALFNYCFAKSQGGSFVLRIEDTDRARSKPEHEAAILEALRWTGLRWDEGPDVGGPKGPYRQSERSEHYRHYARVLLDKGHAFKCFCTPDRLSRLREEQKRAGSNMRYDGCCRRLAPDQIEALERRQTPFTVRMNIPDQGTCRLVDRLRGEIRFDYAQIDHQILLKSDGFPTYHLANVVDDHLMEISHVIRGEEWLPSLPKHLLLYQYFGWQAPEVIHLPLLRNEDQSKLSKRKNPTSILFYRDTGILSEVLINFLGLMAYSLPDGREVFSLQDMVSSFDMNRVSLGGPIFDRKKLKWLNQQTIGAMDPDAVYQRLAEWRLNEAFFRRLVPFMIPRMHTLGDFMRYCDFMFFAEVSFETETLIPKGRQAEDCRDTMQILIWELEALLGFEPDDVESAIKKAAQLCCWDLRDAAHAARVAVCGKTDAPPLFQVMSILGSDICRNRLMQAVQALGPLGKKKLDKLQKKYRAALAQAAGDKTV